MLSDIYFRTQSFWVNWVACPLGAVPYKFDLKRRRLYTTLRAQRRCIHTWMALSCQNLFLIVMMIYCKKRKKFDEFNHAYLGWVISSIWCLCLGIGAFRGERMVYLTNGYFTFLERHRTLFMPDYNPNKCPTNRSIDISCSVSRWSCFMLVIMQTVHSVANCRKSPFFIDYYIPDDLYTLPVIICTTTGHIFVSTLSAVIICTASMYMFTILIHINHIIVFDIRCKRRGTYRTLESLRTAHNMRITYRSLEILNKINMEISGILLYPMNWLMVKMVIFCGASFIKYHKLMTPLVRNLVLGWTISGLLLWAMSLEIGGYMPQYTERAITSWKHQDWGAERKVMAKFKKSCRPLKVSYHKFFAIKRISVLKYLRSVAKGIFKAFVAL